ncbi:hypothetical protein IAQ61_008432 [Plenodomus lingam]|uniref:uncharacterized protein n=1 Tax=Leptosphaeria maculans TaxID=5022 RepID=UPI0033182182|nr:hypothetical protein IAQ61_008432 [Plenodomus lingam]
MFLRNVLARIGNLGVDRVTVVGASKGSGMARRAPWSPLHFVGADNVGADDLVTRMKASVAGPDDLKIIRWVRHNGKLQLEVVSLKYLLRCVDAEWTGTTPQQGPAELWPESGSCTLLQYENRFSVTESMEKISPSVAV